ncbi:MAG: ABC transporter substrate-binding protein [Firmicutes bacterium]|nr:ABC transporter substrate-binding protein [Bacillota bacterium]
MKGFTRRDFLKLSGVGAASAAALALVGCSSKSGDNTESSSQAGNQSSTQTQESSVLETQEGSIVADETTELEMRENVKVGISFLFATLTPFRNTSGQRFPLVRYLYDRLAFLTDTGAYVPQGAKSWTCADDGVTWSVEIYDNITDSEGRPVTANDVKWFLDEGKARASKPCYAKVQEVRVVDDYNLEIVMDKNLADAFEVVLESTFMINQESFEADADEFNTQPVSTSPYKVIGFVPDVSLDFEHRDDFWQDEALEDRTLGHNVKTINMVYISEASQQQVALETKTVDAMPGINATVVDAFKDNDAYLFAMAPANNGNQLRFTGDETRLVGRDENLRKAICYAIDVDMVIQGAANGYAEKMDDFIPRTSGGWFEAYKTMDYFHYDVDLAKDYLSKSDYNGEELVLAGNNQQQRAYTIIQANCQAIGITVKLDIMDNSLFTQISNDGRQWDMAMMSTGNGAANVWTQTFDGDAYEYGDQMGRHDEVLTEMIHETWQVANYTEENITKIRNYIFEHAYAYGLFLSYTLSVCNKSLNIAETVFNTQGQLDMAACKYAKA